MTQSTTTTSARPFNSATLGAESISVLGGRRTNSFGSDPYFNNTMTGGRRTYQNFRTRLGSYNEYKTYNENDDVFTPSTK